MTRIIQQIGLVFLSALAGIGLLFLAQAHGVTGTLVPGVSSWSMQQ